MASTIHGRSLISILIPVVLCKYLTGMDKSFFNLLVTANPGMALTTDSLCLLALTIM